MNIAAQSNHWVLYYLQQANITTRFSNRVIAMDEDDDDDLEPMANNTPSKPKEIITNAGTYVTSGSNAEE